MVVTASEDGGAHRGEEMASGWLGAQLAQTALLAFNIDIFIFKPPRADEQACHTVRRWSALLETKSV